MSAGPERAAIRSILRDDWVADAERDLRIATRRRRDWKGPRVPLLTRLPEPLAEQVRDLAGSTGLSVSEVLALITFAYFNRSGPRR